jgi:hypothetical protein
VTLTSVLLAAYDDQLRGASETADVPTSQDGPVIRVEYPNRGFVSYRSLDGVDGADLDALIARQRDFFAAKGQAVEWKLRGHDLPAALPDRLRGRGIYKALVAVRAARAVELGYKYLQVDASDDSSPILQRLGFHPVTTTTPWVHTPH